MPCVILLYIMIYVGGHLTRQISENLPNLKPRQMLNAIQYA